MKVKAMGKITINLFLILITSLFLTSCGGIVTPGLPPAVSEEEINKAEELGFVYLEVPYEKYGGPNWCLPACGAMTLKYFGISISQSQIARETIDEYGSSSVYKFISYAKNMGLEAKYQLNTIEEIKALLEEDTPVIAVQNYSLTILKSHARVIIGYDDEAREIITNDPTAGKDYRISYDDFLSLNLNSNPDKCKVIILAPGNSDPVNILAESNTNNS